MIPRHKIAARTLRMLRSGLEWSERRLDGLEVRAAQGWLRTRRARREGWDRPWDELRLECTPCFTLSAGRSGTMTLARLGELSIELESVHEPEPNLLTESYLAHRGVVDDDAFWEQVVAVARDWPIRMATHRGRIWFETNNRLTFLADALAAHYPQSRFIVLTRHPVPFAESALARGYYERHVWDHARITPRPTDPAADRWEHMSQLERVGWLWAETYRAADELTASIGSDRVLHLRAEDFFSGDQTPIEEMFRFAGVTEVPSSRAIASVLGQRANAQQERPSGSRRASWDAADVDAFRQVVGDIARRFGYDVDTEMRRRPR